MKTLTPHLKLPLFLGFTLVLLLLAYVFSFKPTLDTAFRLQDKSETFSQGGGLDTRIQSLEQALKGYTADEDVPFEDYNQHIFLALTALSERKRIKLRDFKPYKEEAQDNYQLRSFQVQLEGSFIKLNTFLKALHERPNLGQIKTARFELIQNKRTKEEHLELRFILQRLDWNQTP